VDPQKPCGRALIIANSSFSSAKLSARSGTQVDVHRLQSVFEWLNFEVVVRDNLSSFVSNSFILRIYRMYQYRVTVNFLITVM